MLLKNGLLAAPNQVLKTATPASATPANPSWFPFLLRPGEYSGSSNLKFWLARFCWDVLHIQNFTFSLRFFDHVEASTSTELANSCGNEEIVFSRVREEYVWSATESTYILIELLRSTKLVWYITLVCDLLLKLTMTAPALKGSMNVLRACTKSPSVKRVVMTSSCSAIRYDYNRNEKDPPLDETVWSNIEYCREYKVWAQISHSTKARSMLWTHISSDRTSLHEYKRAELHIEIHSCLQNMINRYLLCW